jgi:membrane protein implicated in regulation of membrane protease activity
MEFKLLYWHWLVLGMVLIIAEIFLPSFTIFWFGLGAIILAGLLLLFKPLMTDRTQAGISREAIMGESGQVIKAPEEGQHGIARFTTPLLGADEWPFICEEKLTVGERVYVKDISGNTLIVETRRFR